MLRIQHWLGASDDDYQRLTALLPRLEERDDCTPEEDPLAELVTVLIEDYEDKPYPMPHVLPNESLKALMFGDHA